MRASHPPEPARPPARLRPLRGEFADGALEQAFRADTLARVVLHQRLSLLVWAGLLLGFALPDYVVLGGTAQFWSLLGYRVGIAALLLGYGRALRSTPALALHDGCLMGLGLLSYPFFFLFYAMRPELGALNTGVIMLMQLAMFLFIPTRVALTLPVAVFGALGTILSVWWLDIADTATQVVTACLVTAPAVIGYVAALRLQKTERQEFWLRRQLQETNRELQGEVERRIALQAELERQAGTDLLTGLSNRRAFAERFPVEAARAQRSGEPLSLAMFDLDHFKQINDRYGHAAGDAVLRAAGHLCARSFRGLDLPARVGGEEFAVLLPGASAQQASAVMERFLGVLAGVDMRTGVGSQSVRVTATCGVAQQHAGESLDGLMARVDAAMYAGKQAGRDRVVLAPPPD